MIRTHYINVLKSNSLAVKYPEIAKEWDYEKNGELTPEKVAHGSIKKFFGNVKRDILGNLQ
ncbi:MAG: zinc-ribbon domain-containing protein [Lachnospiraceae bacterium]|nr:zinc-ribbon domain-containing protein [Lachnospiraceae bacterium]